MTEGQKLRIYEKYIKTKVEPNIGEDRFRHEFTWLPKKAACGKYAWLEPVMVRQVYQGKCKWLTTHYFSREHVHEAVDRGGLEFLRILLNKTKDI